eukprot:TRINITY_DN49052_c0_g1_i1.p1 TRINITY_DN49052_c0_g1~~TRINITY_DN49052_c0_g1_i1.p1  ORF type:complete len:373 (-),score=42.64 TRINITY_DN49052_c0_g1_i1:517-1635(-)
MLDVSVHQLWVLVILSCALLIVVIFFCISSTDQRRGTDERKLSTVGGEEAEASSVPVWLHRLAVFAAVCAGATAMPMLRVLPWQAKWPNTLIFEAHRMRCGTPDCRRDMSCQIRQQNANASLLIGDEQGATACCGDLMLRMLVEVGAFLDSQGFDWYVTFGTLLGGWRNRSIIAWTDDVDILVPSQKGRDALRNWRGGGYRFGHYSEMVLRGCADYDGVSRKFPHHPSGQGAHMWINDMTPWLPTVSCSGIKCDGRLTPDAARIPKKSTQWGDEWYSGRTAFYFMDVYDPMLAPSLIECGGFDKDGTTTRYPKNVIIGGVPFPTHRNLEECLENWYGPNWKTPTHEHVSDYLFVELGEANSTAATTLFLEKG